MKSTFRIAGGALLIVALLLVLSALAVSAQTPTGTPTTAATTIPTGAATAMPTGAATAMPTTAAPTTAAPTVAPTTAAPTVAPTTAAPTVAPTVAAPTVAPTTAAPTVAPTTAPAVSPTPAGAPPLVAGTNRDDPAQSATIGSTIQGIPPGGTQWLTFNYDNNNNAIPRPIVTIIMQNAAGSPLGFEVYSPETLAGNWYDNDPVGRGTQQAIPNCTNPDGSRCMTNNLSWTGGFGLTGTYYVRIINDAVANTEGTTLSPQIIIGGPGLTECRGQPTTDQTQTNTQTDTQGQAFFMLQCQNLEPGPALSGVTVP